LAEEACVSKVRTRLPDDLRHELESSGLPWTTELGKKHLKVLASGHLVAVVSYGGNNTNGRNRCNHLTSLRRNLRALKGERSA